MGRGIAAAIPLTFKPHSNFEFKKQNFTTGFFDNFILNKKSNIYKIKTDLILQNYKSFLLEFYELIEEDFEECTKLSPNAIPNATKLNEFLKVFSHDKRNGTIPFIYDHLAFSTLGGDSSLYWLFYDGSCKAFLEDYSSLMHFERILSKTMKNPLAGAIKFGIFG